MLLNISQNEFNYWQFWIALIIFFLVVEICTFGLTTIWFAAGAAAAAVLDVMDVSFLVQFAAFLFISFLFIVFVRKWALKRFNTKRIKTNAESLIGQKAIVTEDICNLTAAGAVRINGAEWSAKLPEGIDDTLTKGTVVIVQEIRGVKLIVEKDK